MSDALDLLHSLEGLVRGNLHPSFNYRTELSLEHATPASPNKRTGAVGAYAIDSLNHGLPGPVRDALDFEAWLGTQTFMQNEALTKEPIYRQLHAYPHMILLGVAMQVGHEAALLAARRMARSHFAWLLAGFCAGPGREVRDPRPQGPGGMVLLGDGAPQKMRYVAQAGMRGCVVDREGGRNRIMFTETQTPSVMVYQGLGLPIPRRIEKGQQGLWAALDKRWPGIAPWGMTADEQSIAHEFAADPSDVSLARLVAEWMLPVECPAFIARFEDGAVASVLERDRPSSTDPWNIDAWHPGGVRRLATAADGIRKEMGRVLAWESPTAYLTQKEDHSFPPRVVPKPPARELYRFDCDTQRVRVKVAA